MKLKIPFLRYSFDIVRIPGKKSLSKLRSEDIIDIQRDYDKIFCIGFNKTGTTSMAKLFSHFGFSVGSQAVGEILAEEWTLHGRTDRIINFCYTADAFQDAPFNRHGLFKELDKAFPRSKFILTVRDTPEQWFDSLVRFHTKKFSSDKSRPPDEEDKRNALYRYKGYMLDNALNVWDYPKVPMYDQTAYKKKYIDYNESVRDYFRGRPDDFIEINLARKEDFNRLCTFLKIKTKLECFPWVNKT
jgi:hypothetical protein